MDKKAIPDAVVEFMQESEFLHSQMSISMPDYQAAVTRLLDLANNDFGGSSAAAQVLLSCYDGGSWHLNVMDLGSLDLLHIQDAFLVMRGWLFLRERPDEVVEGGDSIFRNLAERWDFLRVENR